MAAWTDIPDFVFRDGLGYQDVNEIKNNIIAVVEGNKQLVKVNVGGVASGGAVATFHGQYVSPLFDDVDSGTAKTINWNQGNEHKLRLTDNVILTFSNPVDGGRYVLRLRQDATGGRTVTWPATVEWPNAVTPVITIGANRVDLVTMMYDAGLAKYLAAINPGYL